MKNVPIFDWDGDSGVARCVLTDGKNIFLGTAYCAEEDGDMVSEKTGCQIALWRAEIAYYTHLRDNEIKPGLKALNQLFYSINQSSKFNQNSYENKMLQRQISLKKDELTLVNNTIAITKQNLKEYIKNKDDFYKHIRQNRGQK